MVAKLKELRCLKGISQQQLADVITVSQQSINKYENHGVEPDISTLIKIAEYFNVSLDYLLGRTEIKEMAEKPKMSELSDEEAYLIKAYRSLNEKQKNCLLTVSDSYK